MENIFYLISAHTFCIEGIRLTKKSRNRLITGEPIGFASSKNSVFEENFLAEHLEWAEMIAEFLDQHQWKDHSISFLLPAEDVSFRKIAFPFQERKKVEQALPYELEEEIMSDLSACTYSSQVFTMSEQNSEALVFLVGKERLNQLKKLCLERNLLIRNVDCSAYALYRSLMNDDKKISRTGDVFQIYLGGDEAFVNTISDGRLDQVKIFPNRIPVILKKHLLLVGNSLSAFLNNFIKYQEDGDLEEGNSELKKTYTNLKHELNWLCSQLTLHLRIKNYVSESQIEIHGIFGPMIKWDGVVFKLRSFPFPESEAFAERSGEEKLNEDSSLPINVFSKTDVKTPDTLEELMEEAKHREKSDANLSIIEKLLTPLMYIRKLEELKEETNHNEESEEKTLIDEHETKFKSSEIEHEDNILSSQMTSVNPKSSMLSLLERKHWGVLGELRNQAEDFIEFHQLSLYHESTPWKRYLGRNQIALSFSAVLIFIILVGFLWQTNTTIDLLKHKIKEGNLLIQTELLRALPKTSNSDLKLLILELKKSIELRKTYIEKSKKFESREYDNLNFLKTVSSLLSEDAPFRVDSLEYGPERFSLSGTIDSYDRLQILKTNLQSIEEFKSQNIVESNRKSPDGIIYRITINLN
tara:strand:- start:2165 stop:4084 length:1920 start_codon:yes stop_codon:yes gene_type:complete